MSEEQDRVESLLGAITQIEEIPMRMGEAIQLAHVRGLLELAKSLASEALEGTHD